MKPLFYMLVGMGVAALIGMFISRKRRTAQQVSDAARKREETLNSAVATNDITRVGKGGVIKLPPFGRNTLGVETYVTRRHRYQSPDGKRTWYEMECEQKGRDVLVEWSKVAGRLDVTVGYEDQNPTLKQVGLTEDDLIRFDESGKGTFEWDGVTWRYENSGENFFYEDEGREREGFYGWDFISADDKRYLSVEKWEGDADFEVFHLWSVDPKGIEVFDGGRA